MYFCYVCASRYPTRLEWCSVCQDGGTIIVEPIRPQTAMRSELQTASARDLVKRQWSMVESVAYPSLLIGKGALVGVWGQPGSGKSTFATRYLDQLDGPVIYFSAEEKLGPTLAARLNRCGVKRDDFNVVGQGSIDDLCKMSRNVKAVALVIDSIAMTTLRATDLRALLEAANVDVLLFILHATKGGDAAGSNAYLHEADVVIQVESLSCILDKSRYQASGLAFPVM